MRPGGNLRSDSALRSLRERGLRAEPISFVPRSERGAQGRAVWYSAMMLDVARLVRLGDLEAAAAAHDAADRLASHRSARFVAEWLTDRGGPDPDPAALDAGTGGALTRLATLTASARSKLGPRLHVRVFAGRVQEASGSTTRVVAEDGQAVAIPSVRSTHQWVGVPVVVDFEEIGSDNTTVWVRPGFDPGADLNERVPGGPRLLTEAERDRLAALASSR